MSPIAAHPRPVASQRAVPGFSCETSRIARESDERRPSGVDSFVLPITRAVALPRTPPFLA
jgi:hypothetical protein